MGARPAKSFPDDDILRVLATARRPLTVAELAEATGWSPTALRDNLHTLRTWWGEPWVDLVADRPYRWHLTQKGLNVANGRGLTRRTVLSKREQAGE